MKIIKLTNKDRFILDKSLDVKTGITTWEGSFWKKINLRRPKEGVKLVIGNTLWGFAFLVHVNSETGEVHFQGDGKLYEQ